MMPTRPRLQRERKCLVREYKMDTSYISWIEQLLITPQKRQRPSPQTVFHSGEQPHLILMLKMADSSMFCLG